MSLAKVYTRAQLGIESPQVQVEVHLSNGLPSLSLVGMPETAVRACKHVNVKNLLGLRDPCSVSRILDEIRRGAAVLQQLDVSVPAPAVHVRCEMRQLQRISKRSPFCLPDTFSFSLF